MKKLKIQEYLVKFDLGNPVDVNVTVYDENFRELNKEEIIEEAIQHAKEVGIELTEKSFVEIATVQKVF